MRSSSRQTSGSILTSPRKPVAIPPRGGVRTGEYEQSSVPGLYVAGSASRHLQLAIVAAAGGAEAAFAINTALLREDLAAEERGQTLRL